MNPLNKVYTFQEAAKLWGLGESTLRSRASRGEFLPDEIRKSGKVWLITDEAMRRIYGPTKEELKQMTKIEVTGIGNDGIREFEVLEKKVLQKQLSSIDRQLLATQLLEYADMKQVSGMAYVYLDARDGRLKEEWLSQGESLHPWDSFYQIILMDEITPISWENVVDEDFIDEYSPEWDEFQKWYEDRGCGTAEEFILDKYGEDELEERKQIIFEHWAESLEFRDDIEEQINEIYEGR